MLEVSSFRRSAHGFCFFFVDFYFAKVQHAAASPKSTFQKAVRTP
jgi:hypothetical protein